MPQNRFPIISARVWTLKCVSIHFMRGRLFLEETFFYTEYMTAFSGGGCWQTECPVGGAGAGGVTHWRGRLFPTKNKNYIPLQRLGSAIPSAIWHSPGNYSQITVRVHSELNQITVRSHSDHAICSTFCISCFKEFNL